MSDDIEPFSLKTQISSPHMAGVVVCSAGTAYVVHRLFTGSINRSKDEGVSGHECLGKGVEKFLCPAIAVGLKNSEKALRCAG